MIALYILWSAIAIGTVLIVHLMNSNYHESRYLKQLRNERLANRYRHNYKIDSST